MEIRKYYYNQAGGSDVLSPKWWVQEEEDVHKHVIACCRSIEDRQSYRRELNLRHARLYGNSELAGLGSSLAHKPKTPSPAKVTLNVIKACIDTTSSIVAKDKPRPMFLTQRGDWTLKSRAKKLTQFISGQFEATKTYKIGQLAFRDSGVFGTGAVKFYTHGNTIGLERVLIDEIIVDDVEAMYGEPRTLYQRKYIHRDILLSLFGKDHADAILRARPGLEKDQRDNNSDMIYTVEAWHLPSSSGAGDGAHAIAIDGGTLVFEDYKKDRFPFEFLHWTRPLVGFYGTGIAEEITGIQLEVNKLLRDIQKAQHLIGVPQIWLESTTKILTQVTNEIGAINRYNGEKPVFYTPASMANDVFQHVWNLYRKAFEIIGVSELSATSKKPAGLESGEALQNYADIETRRFVIVAQDYQDFYMRIANQFIELSRDLYKGTKVKLQGKGGKFIESLDWEDIDLDADQCVMKAYPTNLLPEEPAGRLERVEKLIQMGWIDREHAMSMIDFPDVEQYMSIETSMIDDIQMIIEEIVEHGRYEPPEPFMNLKMAVQTMQGAYIRARVEKVPEERLELMRTWMNQAAQMLQDSLPEPTMAPAQPATQQPLQ